MNRLIGVLYFAFPAVLLLAQTSRPERGGYALPKKFPPEMRLSSVPSRHEVKLSHRYCVYPSPDRKSLLSKRCEPASPGFLIQPLTFVSPAKKLKK